MDGALQQNRPLLEVKFARTDITTKGCLGIWSRGFPQNLFGNICDRRITSKR
jgi:hypothetical protein|tara:strand:- start:50562 stop:50717 length:156 start_codon:yes stop_codon:yes gene_type:complete